MDCIRLSITRQYNFKCYFSDRISVFTHLMVIYIFIFYILFLTAFAHLISDFMYGLQSRVIMFRTKLFIFGNYRCVAIQEDIKKCHMPCITHVFAVINSFLFRFYQEMEYLMAQKYMKPQRKFRFSLNKLEYMFNS